MAVNAVVSLLLSPTRGATTHTEIEPSLGMAVLNASVSRKALRLCHGDYQTPITSAAPPAAVTLATPVRTFLSHASSAGVLPVDEGSTGVPKSSSSMKYVSSNGDGAIDGLRSTRMTGTPKVVNSVPIMRCTVRLCAGLGGAG